MFSNRSTALLAILVLLFGSLPAEENEDPGLIHFPAPGSSLTVVRENETFHAEIPLRNPYDRAGRIVRSESTCACNILKVENDFLLPGEETRLIFNVDNKRVSGDASQIVWLYFSDPHFEPLEIRVRWQVRPLVAVDVLPPSQRSIQRPDDILWRDIYRLETVEKPANAARLQKNMLFSTVPEETPEGGFEITGVDYEGSLWSFVIRRVDEQQTLLLLRAADTDRPMPQGNFDETFTVHTNHPDKPEIVIELATLIDEDADRFFEADNPLLAPPGM